MEKEVAGRFHGRDYVISWTVYPEERLEILIEDDVTGDRWYTEYEASYVEEITRKTDILTSRDLELLKNRQQLGHSATKLDLSTESGMGPRQQENIKRLSKRYLIVTYVATFDRVHFPLPVAVCNQPTLDMLQRTIDRLRSNGVGKAHNSSAVSRRTNEPSTHRLDRELHDTREKMQSLEAKVSTLESENQRLKEFIRKNKALKKKSKAVSEMSAELQVRLESERTAWETERTILRNELNSLREQLDAGSSSTRQGHSRAVRAEKQVQVLQERVASLEGSLASTTESHKRIQERRKKELDKAVQELDRLRISNRQLRAKLRDQSTSRGVTKRTLSSSSNIPRQSQRSGSIERGRGLNRSTGSIPRNVSGTRRGKTAAATARQRSKSPRFDPTAYQREKEERRKRLQATRSFNQRAPMRSSSKPPPPPPRRSTTPTTTSRPPMRKGHVRSSTYSSGYTSADSTYSNLSRGSRASRLSQTSKGSRTSQRSSASRLSQTSKGSRVSQRSSTSKVSNTSKGSRTSQRSSTSRLSQTSKGSRVSQRSSTSKVSQTSKGSRDSQRPISRQGKSRSPLTKKPWTGASYKSGQSIKKTATKKKKTDDGDSEDDIRALLGSSQVSEQSVEIDDIDRRLAQLQDFLRQEKAKGGSSHQP